MYIIRMLKGRSWRPLWFSQWIFLWTPWEPEQILEKVFSRINQVTFNIHFDLWPIESTSGPIISVKCAWRGQQRLSDLFWFSAAQWFSNFASESIVTFRSTMDKSKGGFQSPFNRPNADQMAAYPTFLPSQKTLKGIVAGESWSEERTLPSHLREMIIMFSSGERFSKCCFLS